MMFEPLAWVTGEKVMSFIKVRNIGEGAGLRGRYRVQFWAC